MDLFYLTVSFLIFLATAKRKTTLFVVLTYLKTRTECKYFSGVYTIQKGSGCQPEHYETQVVLGNAV